MSVWDILTVTLIMLGALFFLAGTVGMLRFPDVYTRLHALTKADNLGLGLIVAGLALQADGVMGALKLILIWLLALLAAATISQLVAQSARQAGVAPWRRH